MNNFWNNVGQWFKDNGPAIATAVGIAAGAAAIGFAVKETLDHGEEIIEDHNERAEEARENETGIVPVYAKTAAKVVKHYWPTLALEGVSIGCIILGFKTLSKQNKMLVAAYGALSTAFMTYRERIKEEYGEDADAKAICGKKETVIDAETGEVTEREDFLDFDCCQLFYEASAPNTFNKDKYQNRFLIRTVEKEINSSLRKYGYIDANQVWKKMGMRPTVEGARRFLIFNRTSENIDNQFRIRLIRDSKYISDQEYLDGQDPEVLLEINCYQGVNELKNALPEGR